MRRSSVLFPEPLGPMIVDRKSTRLNSSHLVISYAVFCLKKKTIKYIVEEPRAHTDTDDQIWKIPQIHRRVTATSLSIGGHAGPPRGECGPPAFDARSRR